MNERIVAVRYVSPDSRKISRDDWEAVAHAVSRLRSSRDGEVRIFIDGHGKLCIKRMKEVPP
jgi:hypothetical protein